MTWVKYFLRYQLENIKIPDGTIWDNFGTIKLGRLFGAKFECNFYFREKNANYKLRIRLTVSNMHVKHMFYIFYSSKLTL